TRWRETASELAWLAAGGLLVIALDLGQAAWASSVHQVVYSIYTFAFENYARVFATRPPWGQHAFSWEPPTWLWLQRWSRLFLVGESVALVVAARRGIREPSPDRRA